MSLNPVIHALSISQYSRYLTSTPSRFSNHLETSSSQDFPNSKHPPSTSTMAEAEIARLLKPLNVKFPPPLAPKVKDGPTRPTRTANLYYPPPNDASDDPSTILPLQFSTFHLFPELPIELQLLVWAFTLPTASKIYIRKLENAKPYHGRARGKLQ